MDKIVCSLFISVTNEINLKLFRLSFEIIFANIASFDRFAKKNVHGLHYFLKLTGKQQYLRVLSI